MSRVPPAVGTIAFFVLAPGTVAGLLPFWLTRWNFGPPLLGLPGERALGALLVVAGGAALLACFVRFAREGRGTPAPLAPTQTLVASGLYRHVRNPMYVALVAILAGEAIVFGSRRLALYALGVWLAFHAFVVLYEEPTLHRRFGAEYAGYCRGVRRWRPRLRPWRAGSE